MRHSTNEATKKIAPELGLGVVGAVFGGTLGGQAIAMAGQFAVGSAFMKYSRNAESQADHVGAQIMYDAGYDPYQLALFFAKLDEESGSRGSQFFSDHPNPGNRSQAIRTEIQQFPRKQFITDTTEFDRIHQLAMSQRTYSAKEIQSGGYGRDGGSSGGGGNSGRGAGGRGGRNQDPGEDQAGEGRSDGGGSDEGQEPAGNGRASSSPSSASATAQTLEHDGYTLRYPNDWRAYGDSHSPVTIAPTNGIVNNQVAYGAIVSLYKPQNGAAIDDGTQQLIASLQQANPALKAIGKADTITVNGVHGRSIDMAGQSPLADRESGQQQRERDWLVTLPREDGTLAYLIFIAPDAEFMSMRPTFQQMLRSVHLQ
jgi:hypothetical protein